MSVQKVLGKFLSNTFLPSKYNNQRPRILHPAGLSVLVGLFLLVNAVRSFLLLLPGFILGYSSSVTVDQVIAMTNQERSTAGLPPLRQNPLLTQAAYAKANDMFTQDYWAHVSPSGTQPWQFIRNAGYGYRYAGENLARDFAETPSLMQAWLASTTHRDNILSSRYQDIGVAVIDGRLGGIETRLVVQMFGSPVAPAVARVEPQTQPAPTRQPSPVQITPVPTGITPESEITPRAPTPVAQEIAETQATPTEQPQFAGTSIIEAVAPPPREERLVSPSQVTQVFGMILVALILGTLVVDWAIAHRRKSVRLVGRNWAHLTYLGTIALMLIQYAQGRIL